MQATSFINLAKKGVINNFSVLRTNNANGYPFITLMGKKGVTNIYFSKNAGESVLDTFGEGNRITEFLKTANVILTKNANGEERYKIAGSGEYDSIDALGITSSSEDNFDYAKFEEQFASQSVTV